MTTAAPRRRSPTALHAANATLVVALAAWTAWPARAAEPGSIVVAQAGSTGGTIGVTSKTVGGSSDSGARSVQRSRPAKQPAKAHARAQSGEGRSGHSLSSYDGMWVVTSIGSCGYKDSLNVSVSNGVMTGPGVTGQISPGGGVNGVVSVLHLRMVFKGHASPNGGSGSWMRNDGCSGKWTSAKT